jgi:RNA polymerase sigma factor (sigma-70 family)
MDEAHQNLLWTKFKTGDDDALSKLYKEYAHQMYSYGLKITSDKLLVNDCIQDVFIQLIDKRKKIEISSRIHVYLFKSLRNRIFEQFRTQNRRNELLELINEENTFIAPNAEQILINSEFERNIKTRIGKLIESLPKRQKEIIFLKFTEDMNYDEIAELLHIDNASARKLLYRSLKTIKEHLSKKILLLFVITRSITHPNSPAI